MSSIYLPQFSNQTFPFDKRVKIYRSQINKNTSPQYFLLLDGKLYTYTYNNFNWETQLILNNSVNNQVIYFPKILKDKESILLLKSDKGINFYQYADSKFNPLLESNNPFQTFKAWSNLGNIIKSGHFCSNKDYIGIVSKNRTNELQFHIVVESDLEAHKNPFYSLNDNNLNILRNSSTSEAHFFLADLKRKGKENVIVRNSEGLNIYEFDEQNILQQFLQVPESSMYFGKKFEKNSNDFEENIFFPDLTGQPLKDIVLLNASGLFVYQYNIKQGNYQIIDYNPLFDKQRGWNSKYVDTIRFKDINSDGNQEMFFTGPQGMDILTFDNSTFEWNSVLDISNITVPERHSNIVEIIPSSSGNTEYPILITQHQNEMHWAKIVPKNLNYDYDLEWPNEDSTNDETSLPVIPEVSKLKIQGENKTIMLLRDQLDCSSVMNGVDKHTGKVNFKLPLIGLSNFAKGEKINLYYNGNNKESTILGVGWSFPVNAVLMDHHESIFPENERFILLLDNFPQFLILDLDNSTDNIYKFKLSDQKSETQIRYFRSEERWEIDFRGTKQIYGRQEGFVNEAINYDISWENWRGAGSSPSGQVQLATAWYLIEMSSEHSAMYYTYDLNNVSVPGSEKEFTREVYLKSIKDTEGNEIIFNYSSKHPDEYDVPPLINENGNYNTKRVQTRSLIGYSVTSYNYIQDIFFTYKIESGNRLLTKIEQSDDPSKQPILEFSYKTILNSYVLQQVILPTGTIVEFNYETIKSTSDFIQKNDLTCEVEPSYKIDYGQDFVLISYINNYNHVVLKMFNRELTNEIYSSLSRSDSLKLPILGKKSVLYYDVKIFEESLAFILDYGDDKEVCLVQKEKDNKWSLNPIYYNYDKDAVIQFGNDFIAVLDAPKILLEIIVWAKKSKEWSKEKIANGIIENSKDSLLKVSDKVFFIYDDKNVTVGYRNKKNEWQSKDIITLPGIIKTIKDNLNKFDLETESYDRLMFVLKYKALQVSNNVVLLNWWNIEDTKIYSEIKLYSLNHKYEVAHQEDYTHFQDDLYKISKEIKINDERKIDFFLAYKRDGDQFKVYVKNFTEDSLKSLYELCGKNDNCVSRTKKDIELQVNNSSPKNFFLNVNEYLARIQLPDVTCGSANYTFTGDKWQKGKVTEQNTKSDNWSFSIDEFVLEKENAESSIKLYKKSKHKSQEENRLDLEVKNITQIYNMYPKYLIYRTENEDLKIVFYEFLDTDFVEKFTLPEGETLSLKSDYNTMVTHARSTTGDNEHLTLNLRPLFNVKSHLPNPVITKLTVTFDNDYKRSTDYHYDSSSVKVIGDVLFYENTSIIPGNDKSTYGWVEESQNSTGNINKVYDGQGKLVKILREEPSKNVTDLITDETESTNSVKKNSVLFDVTGNLIVAQFYPYTMTDDEVSYYGFEDYEVKQVMEIEGDISTNQSRWIFNERDVVKQQFSLTGENYLNLTDTNLVGEFKPTDQNQHYVVSCWVRSPGSVMQIGKIAPNLKVEVLTDDNKIINGHFSEVKFQYDDWSYLEVVIDLFYSKHVYKDLASNYNLVLNENPLKIVVTVSSSLNSTLHVDHIRFSPLNSDFQATTYIFKTKEIKEVINANGLIRRCLYNIYQDQIASINENGEIEKLNSYTKSSSIDRIVNLKSQIQIEPHEGFYEDFNPYSFKRRWRVDNDQNWQISPSEIHHTSDDFDQLKLRNMYDTFDSYGVRLHFSLQTESTLMFYDVLHLQSRGNSALIVFSDKVRKIPMEGELLLIVEHNRLIVWIDGGLYFDEGGQEKLLLNIDMSGSVKVRDLILFFKPSVQVTYFNALREKVQEINLESANSVIVTEFLYDELGRQCVTTKATQLQRSINQSVIAYYPDFVTNKNPLSNDSVWKLGRIQGAFEVLEPYNYYQAIYNNNPLNENSAIGFPGQEFSVWGNFTKRFSSSTKNAFIKNCYPVDQNYRYQVEYKLGGIENIKVFDKKNNTVVALVQAPGEMDLLTTYEYNDDGKLIQMLSPLYHKKVGTSELQCSSKENDQNNSLDKQCLSKENEQLNLLLVTNSYDKMGSITTRTTPDSGKVEYIYSDSGRLKYNIFYSNFNSSVIENVVYYDYDHLERLNNTGKLISPTTKEELINLNLTKDNTEVYQLFYHSDFEREPIFRGKLKRMITYNNGIPFIEEYLLNEDKRVSSKRIIVLNENSEEDLIVQMNKKYKAGKLIEIEYPFKILGRPFKVYYSYNKLGKIEGISTPLQKNLLVKYAYNSNGRIDTEHHLPDQTNFNFTRKYSYNSASYLTKLQDKYLTENIYYTHGSYSGRGFGDGSIARTEFEATWHQYADSSKISLNEQSFSNQNINVEESKLCFNKLKDSGYIDQYNHQAKIYYPSLEVNFPAVCSEGITSRQIQNILGKEGFPLKYGHLYDYGTYQELIKAKYFVGEEIPAPLEPDTFAEIIPTINVTTSRSIWNILDNSGYIISDRLLSDEILSNSSYFQPHGKKGKSFIRSALFENLGSISDSNRSYKHYNLLLEKALASYFSKRQNLSSFKANVEKTILGWSQQTTGNVQIQERQKDATAILKMLNAEDYFNNPIDKDFNELLEKYHAIIPEIIAVLSEYFSKALGEAEFDVEAFEIDENGNHKKFYRGSERFQLQYRSNSNQIDTVKLESYALPNEKIEFAVKHDSRGNVIEALHKGIKNITYHPVSNRATSIELENGKKVIFHYDALGERIHKRVLDKMGELKKEIYYVRDEFGRSLVERELTWSSSNLPPSVLVTVFIYGPNGLVGFIRRDEYYSVITDHEGSIRLIVKDNEVVAAYDYLPYGNLMRQYGTNAEAHISYRYTGEEWDEETGLYNYHARFYDPSIGRFYQHDPKMQYFSPYKYAGNSPVSIVDPNGEFAFLLAVLILGLVGAYLGAADASGTFNPLKWNFKDPKLYAGLIFGFVGGALIPVFFLESVTVFTSLGLTLTQSYIVTSLIGGVGAFLGMTRAANEWDPSKWDLTKPELWNGAFTGFATFSGAPAGISSGVNFFKSLPAGLSRWSFAGATLVSGLGLFSLKLASNDYDLSKPAAYYDFLESFLFAADIPIASIGGFRFLKKNFGELRYGFKRSFNIDWIDRSIGFHEVQQFSFKQALRKLVVRTAIPLSAGIFASSLYTGDDFSRMSTYEAFINGAFFGSTLSSHLSSRAYFHFRKRRLEIKENFYREAQEHATKSINKYIEHIQGLKLESQPYKNLRIVEQLREGKIPNSVLSVTKTTDGAFLISFSGLDKQIGFVSIFYEGKEAHLLINNNRMIGGTDVQLNDDPKINAAIKEAIAVTENGIIDFNHENYLERRASVETELRRILYSDNTLIRYFNNREIQTVMQNIDHHMEKDGLINSKDDLINIISETMNGQLKILSDAKLRRQLSVVNNIRENHPNPLNRLRKANEDLIECEQKFGIEQNVDLSQPFDTIKNNLLDRINNLARRETTLINYKTRLEEMKENVWHSFYKGHFQIYFDRLLPWEPINCAEPHVISFLTRSKNIFPQIVSKTYTIRDIEFISAFDIRHTTTTINQISPRARCSNCQETTKSIKHVVTDPGWETTLDNARKSLKTIPKISFIYPILNVTSMRKRKVEINGQHDSSRKKRSIVNNYINSQDLLIDTSQYSDNIFENYENNADYVENDYVSANNVEDKTEIFANNFFGWIRTSWNQLFNSRAILPENVQTPNMLPAITHSNNSLRAATALVDVNSTILLLDTVMRKITGQKFLSSVADNDSTLIEARGYSLEVGLAFEKTMKYAASKSGISMHRFNIHYIDIQDKVIDKIISGRLDEIAEILILHAEKACPLKEKDCPGKLSPKKFKKFVTEFSKRINVELNELMHANKNIKDIY